MLLTQEKTEATEAVLGDSALFPIVPEPKMTK